MPGGGALWQAPFCDRIGHCLRTPAVVAGSPIGAAHHLPGRGLGHDPPPERAYLRDIIAKHDGRRHASYPPASEGERTRSGLAIGYIPEKTTGVPKKVW